jgi:hypothetical protein
VELLVQPSLPRQLGQAKREPRVRDDRRPVVLEARLREPPVQRVVGAGAEAVASMQLFERDPFRRILRMQVEGKPEDLGVELAPRPLGRLLAEPAERSDVVAPDDDRVLGHSTGNVRFERGG